MNTLAATYVGWTVCLLPITGAVATDRVVLPDDVELRIGACDELGNSVPDNRFVRGEVIIVRVTLSALRVLQAKADLDEAKMQVTLLSSQETPEQTKEAKDRMASAEARLAKERRKIELAPLRGVAAQLAMATLLTTSGEEPARTELRADIVEHGTGEETESRTGGARIEVWWSLETAVIALGKITLEVAPKTGAVSTVATTLLDLVAPEQTTQDNRCRVAYIPARLASKAGRYRDAAEHAERAAKIGDRLGYHRMAALSVLGDAHYALNDTQAALDAYRQALEIAEVAFPNSHLQVFLAHRVRELGGG